MEAWLETIAKVKFKEAMIHNSQKKTPWCHGFSQWGATQQTQATLQTPQIPQLYVFPSVF